jgi:hypothetical protein
MGLMFDIAELVPGGDGEPRMSAALLGERLGIANRQAMMRLVERHTTSLLRFGGGFSATVAKNPSEKGGRPIKDYLLNEGQALFITARSETALANEVLIGLVTVFMAWRHGRLVPGGARAEPQHAEAPRTEVPIAVIDKHRLLINRAYLATLSEAHQATARARVANMREIAALVEAGMARVAAMEVVSAKTGIAKHTLYNHLRLIRMVPEPDWEAALAPQWKKGALARLADKAALARPRPSAILRRAG